MAHVETRADVRAAAPLEPDQEEPASPAQDPRRDLAEMLRDEFEAIHGALPEAGLDTIDARLADLYEHVHALPPDVGRSALCLSGGGIRSAAFSFGVLRALATAGVLHRFHYLSTVSGGGYIGSWLTAWIHRHFSEARDSGATPSRRERLAQVSALLAEGASGRALGGEKPPEPWQVAHVRRFTNYLSPRTGAFSLDTWTLGAIYLRNLLLNWLVVLPLLGAALIAPRILVETLVATGLIPEPGLARPAAVLLPAAAAFLVWLALIARTAVRGSSADVGEAEDSSRREGGYLRFGVVWMLLTGLTLYGPELLHQAPSLLATAGGVSGIATLLLKKLGDRRPVRTDRVERSARLTRLATTGAAVLTIALILVVVSAVMHALVGRAHALWATSPATMLAITAVIALAALAISAMVVVFVDINEFSLHALYRNRLVRAFLRASRGPDAPESDTAFDEKDDLTLAQLWPSGPATGDPHDAPHLFHVLNATLNDLGGTRPEWNERKGVSFTFSPLHLGAHIAGRYGEVGGTRGGYRRLDRAAEGPDAVRLGTAMSISGAAASPNMGYHSSAAVTFLLALFNVRLGWWLRAPWDEGELTTLGRTPAKVWRAWWAEAFGGTRFTSPVLNVSDGGHFDNLGLYEMVRRRCRYIVVVDAGQDGGRTFASLGEALRKIRVDFGVPVTVNALDIEAGTGRGKGAGHAYHGVIHYSRVDRVPAPGGSGSAPAPDGELIYIRPFVSGDEPVDVQAYHRLNPAFPHESTTDQWFSESQFESYRSLGEHSVRHLLNYYHASKGQPRPAGGALMPSAGVPGLSPALFCHQIAEALALMRRHKELSSHAGGVVYRRAGIQVEFLLVLSTDALHRILPKGYIEPWEDAVAAAIREVREEAGYTLAPVRSLGVSSFETPTRKVTTAYFLMEEVAGEVEAAPFEHYRAPEWFTVEAAGEAKPPAPPDVIKVLARARELMLTHAGGVVYRQQDGQTEFLLVRSSKAPRYVLPKGHIDEGERAANAARREVAEEAGQNLSAGPSVGVFCFGQPDDPAIVEYFLMECATPEDGSVGEPGRDPRWFTIEDATADPMVFPDVIHVLRKAATALRPATG